MQEIYDQLIRGLQKYFKQSDLKRAVVGLSGGVDSALTLKLAVYALGADKITAISMPEVGVSSQENIEHARKLAQAMEVTFLSQAINAILTDFKNLSWQPTKTALQNTKARIRAVLLYNYANSTEALVLGTSNKSEMLLGYGTKYGDLAADLEVIGELYKEEVWALADFVGLPPEIIHKKPTAELYTGQTDEAELGATYNELDPILKRLHLGENDLLQRGINPMLVHSVLNRIKKNRHKTETPPIIKIKRDNIAEIPIEAA